MFKEHMRKLNEQSEKLEGFKQRARKYKEERNMKNTVTEMKTSQKESTVHQMIQRNDQ